VNSRARYDELLDALGGELRVPFCPVTASMKQEAFLRSPHQEVLFGGAAGGGKSVALLMGALRDVDVPGYSALLLRRTFPQLTQPGGLIPMSKQWIGGRAHFSEQQMRWTFPSGATISFGHIQNEADIYRYLGSEYQFIGFDELTAFSEQMYRYLFSRLRRLAGSVIPLRMRASSNPGGIGHDWVRRRFVDAATREPGTQFIRSLLDENPGLDVTAYREGLAKLHPLDRQRLEHGDWDVTGTGTLFQRADLLAALVPADYPPGDQRVRAWDLAATEPHEGNRDPDYTVGMLADLSSLTGILTVRDVVRVQAAPDDVDRVMRLTAERDGYETLQRVEQEGGSAGKMAIRSIVRSLQGYAVHGVHPTGDKVTRALPFAAMLGNGLARIVEAPWTMALIDEYTRFPEGAHDDQVDAGSNAHEYLTSGSRATMLVPDDELRLDL
jgi:predicted phage terminase large subunit-like protein